MSVTPYREYQEIINAALRLLKQSGKVIWCELDREKSSRNAIFHRITVPSLNRRILVKFTLWEGGDDSPSANFIPIELPGHSQILSAERICDILLQEINTREKGIFHEGVISQMLEVLKEQGSILGYAKARDRDDMNGVDFMVRFPNLHGVGTEMPLQVKSSIAGQRKHAKEFPAIPSICIRRANWTGKKFALEHLRQIVLAYKENQTDVLHL